MERRSFLRLLGSGGAAASALPTPVRGAVHAEPSRTPLEIGQERQLFLDDHVVETMEPRVFRLLNQPVRYRDNPVIPLGTDWEQKGGLSHGGDAGAVLYDPERKLYRFYGWMIPWPPLGSSVRKFIFYAESEDGLHWRKPPLGQVRYLGYDTNFIRLPFLGDATPGNLGVFRDPAARRPQERYKIVFQGKQDGAGGSIPVIPPMASASIAIPSPGPSFPSTAIPTTTRSGIRGPTNTWSTIGPTRDWIVGFSRNPSILRVRGCGRRPGRPAGTSWTGTVPATSRSRKSGTSVFMLTPPTASGTGISTPWRCSLMVAGWSVSPRSTII